MISFEFQLNEIDRLEKEFTNQGEQLQQRLELSQKTHFQLHEFNKQSLFHEQWFDHLHRTVDGLFEQNFTIEEKLRRLHDIQLQLDQRKQMLQHLPQDYPQIHHLVSNSIQKFMTNIERLQANVMRKEEVMNWCIEFECLSVSIGRIINNINGNRKNFVERWKIFSNGLNKLNVMNH